MRNEYKNIYKEDGTIKDNFLFDKEISKIESIRPRRIKRNGIEVNNSTIEDCKQKIYDLRKQKKNINSVTKHKLFNGKINRIGKLNLKPFNSGCIYMLYNLGEVVYIGETECFARRLSEHIKDGIKKFDSFKIRYYIENSEIRKNYEVRMIKKYNPIYNTLHNKI